MAKHKMVRVKRLTLCAGPNGIEHPGSETMMAHNEAETAAKAGFVVFLPAKPENRTRKKDGDQ